MYWIFCITIITVLEYFLFVQVIGVAQVINKDSGKGEFTEEDEEVSLTVMLRNLCCVVKVDYV